MLENMGFKVVDERTYQIARNPEDKPQENGQGTADVWFHDMLLERADGRAVDLDANKHGLEAAFLVVMRGIAENDGYNALVLAAGMMWRDVALIRTISRFLRQIRVPYSQDYMWATLVKQAPVAADIVRLFHARFDPRGTMSVDERRAHEAEVAAAIEIALQKVESLDEDRILRHFVNAVQAAIRTNFYQIDAAGQPEAAHRRQILQPQARRPAGAEAALRDFRLFAAGRGRAHAIRQGGARRHPLVRPAAGLPHRGLRAGEGAAGQERGHRSGRRQGRLRAEAAARYRRERRDARGGAGRGHGDLQAVHFDPARHHRQSRRQGRRSARQRRAPRRQRSLSRGRRRQGHRDLLRHRQRDRAGARLLARRRLRVGRLGRLRPQEDGHHRARRLGIGQAPFPRDGYRYRQDAVHHRRRRRHVGRRLRQRHAAGEDDQARRRLRPPRHLHRSRPRSGTKLRRAPAPVRSAALELAGLRQGAHLQGRRRVLARAQGDRAVAGSAGGDRLRQAEGDAAAGDERDPRGAGDLLFFGGIGTYVRASIRDRRRGRRPRQRCDPRQRRGAARQGDRGRRQSRHDATGPGRGGHARRQAQHRRHRQLGRRQHLRPRGQYQDRAGAAAARRPAVARRAQRAARRDDRRRGAAGAAQQLPADPGAVARRAARA